MGLEQRLHKIIAAAGICSRRKAEQLILEGAVTLNGRLVTEVGVKADPDKDKIKVNGKLLMTDVEKVYVVFNKPRGVVSALSDPEGRPCLDMYVKDIKARIVPVGRLDFNSEGVLLMTNDGAMVNQILKARHLTKTYHIKAKGHYTAQDLLAFKDGIFTQEGVLRFKKISLDEKLKNKSWIGLEVKEGSALDIREIFNRKGILVDRIMRTAIGKLQLGDLKPGEYRLATAEEFAALVQGTETLTAENEEAVVEVNFRTKRDEDRLDPWKERHKKQAFREKRESYSQKRESRRELAGERRSGYDRFEKRPVRGSFGGELRSERAEGAEGESFTPSFEARGPRRRRVEGSGVVDRPRRSFGDKPSFGSDRPRRSFGERREGGFGGERRERSFGDKPRRSFGDRKPFGERREGSFGDRPRRSFGDKPSFGGERRERSFGDRPRRSFGDRPRRSFGDRPSFGGARRTDDRGDRPRRSFGERREGGFGGERRERSFGDKPRRSFGDHPRRSFGDKPSFGDRPRRSFGDRKPSGDRPQRRRGTGGVKVWEKQDA